MDSSRKLEEIFSHFPGIGPRQARRFVYFLLNKSPAYIKEFMNTIEQVKKSANQCQDCHRFFIPKSHSSHTKNPICHICSDQNRDHSNLMVVARDSDFESIEKCQAYRGLYFILGGTVPILDKEPDKRIRLKKLLEYIAKLHAQSSGLKEIILSLNTTPDGEHTAVIIKEAIEKMTEKMTNNRPKISILGRGLSTGAELEYADDETIKNALSNRR